MKGTTELHLFVFLLLRLQYFIQSSFLWEAFSLSFQKAAHHIVPVLNQHCGCQYDSQLLGHNNMCQWLEEKISVMLQARLCENRVNNFWSWPFRSMHNKSKGNLPPAGLVYPWTKTSRPNCFKLCGLKLNYRIDSWPNGIAPACSSICSSQFLFKPVGWKCYEKYSLVWKSWHCKMHHSRDPAFWSLAFSVLHVCLDYLPARLLDQASTETVSVELAGKRPKAVFFHSDHRSLLCKLPANHSNEGTNINVSEAFQEGLFFCCTW